MRDSLVMLGIAALVVIAGAWYAFGHADPRDTNLSDNDTKRMQPPITITPIEHATAVLAWGDAVFYTDPVGGAEGFAGQPPADIVFVTDIHGDHFEPATLEAVLGEAALVVPQAVKEQLPAALASRAQVMNNGDTLEIDGFRIEAIPMYNLPDAENSNFHTKGRGNGYLIEKAGTRLYIAGDTAGTPEMRALADIDVALIPMNLPYTMSVEDAADAVRAFKPRFAYPYHYRGPGGLSDVARFKELVEAGGSGIQAVLLDWYPQE